MCKHKSRYQKFPTVSGNPKPRQMAHGHNYGFRSLHSSHDPTAAAHVGSSTLQKARAETDPLTAKGALSDTNCFAGKC
jgi:hypothetical protein